MAEEEIASHEKVLIQALDEIKDLKSWIDRQPAKIKYECVACPICWEETEEAFIGQPNSHTDGCPWRISTRSPEGPQIRPQPSIRR